MATLYEMNAQAKALYELLQSDEIDEDVFRDTLESIGIEQKLESYCYIIKQLEADEEMYRAEAARLLKRARPIADKIERMKGQIIAYFAAVNRTRERAGVFAASVGTSQSVDVRDESLIPEQYFKPQPAKVDRAAIREVLKKGESVPGAELVTNTNVRIGYGKVDDAIVG